MSKFIDIHSHVLPGVDDGCEDLEQSLAVLKEMEARGVTDLFLTPHYCKRRNHVASPQKVKDAYDLLCSKAAQEGINLCLHQGTEMEYSQDGARYIHEGRINTLGGTKYILVEFPPYIEAETFVYRIREILAIGLVPVVAHIERYIDVVKNPECVVAIKNMGALIQVNIRSITYHSFKIRRFLKKIFSMRYADFLAGDVHLCPIEKKEMEKCRKFVVKHSDEEYFEALTYGNAKKFLLRQGL